jgi:flagellar protein FliO/FliZ
MKQMSNRLIIFIIMLLIGSIIIYKPAAAENKNVADWLNEQTEDNARVEAPANEEIETIGRSSNSNIFLLVIQLIFYTLLVVGLIYGLIKFLAVRQRKLQHHQVFQMLGGAPLGHNKSLQLVKVGGKIYLLGVADQITLVKEIEDRDEMAAIEEDVMIEESVFSKQLINRFTKISRKESGADSFQELFSHTIDSQKKTRQKFEEILKKQKNDEERRP